MPRTTARRGALERRRLTRPRIPSQSSPVTVPKTVVTHQAHIPGCPYPLPTVSEVDAERLVEVWGGTVRPVVRVGDG